MFAGDIACPFLVTFTADKLAREGLAPEGGVAAARRAILRNVYFGLRRKICVIIFVTRMLASNQHLRYYFRNAYVGLRRRPSCGAKRRLTARPTQDRAFVSETLVHKIAVHKVAVDKAAGR